jgi:hypothetical protein
MPQFYQKNEIKIIQKNGTDTLLVSVDPIVIELNITINSEGGIAVSATGTKKVDEEEEKINWAIPTFDNKKIKFGKTE